MSLQPVIIDTNVVVAGFPLDQERSPVVRILDDMLDGSFPFVVSDALIAEYQDVLMRPRLRTLHGLTALEVEAIVADIARHAIVVAPAAGPAAPDPGDQLLWDLLATRTDCVLVTCDKLLLEDARMRGRVVSPQTFAAARAIPTV